MIPLNTVIGGRELSAWQPVHGVTWVQARISAHARRLAQRSDGRLVMTGVHGGFLRTFEFEGKTLAWASRLIGRYTNRQTSSEAATNEPKIGLDCPARVAKGKNDHLVELATASVNFEREAALI